MRLNRCSAAAGVIALLLMTSCTRPGATHAKVSPTPSPTPTQTAVTWTVNNACLIYLRLIEYR